MDANELRERYAKGERNFKAENLSGLDLKNTNLGGIVLRGAQANLAGIHLAMSDFQGFVVRFSRLKFSLSL